MNTTMEEKKQQAIKYLERLNIYPPYIDGFKEENKVCFFERFGRYWAEQEPEIQAKIREIETKYKCLVYAVTHEFTDFGECWDFLIVTDYKCEWRTLLMPMERNAFSAFAYVWNKDVPSNSEFGSIGVRSFGGGICRIA